MLKSERHMRKFLSFIWEISKLTVIALLIVVPIRYYVFQPFIVKGQSMEPNFENGDYLIVDELSYHLRAPQRGEVIVFKYPLDPSQRYIKRIIGLPGETVEIKDGKIDIYRENSEVKILDELTYLPSFTQTEGNIRITLNRNEYFVLGDNRLGMSSYDSRRWGSLPRENIIGRVVIRAWPVATMAKIEAPAY
jgi:signal peptidase I